jgi:hypothetical protein
MQNILARSHNETSVIVQNDTDNLSDVSTSYITQDALLITRMNEWNYVG